VKPYKIKFLKSVIEENLPALPVKIEARVREAMDKRIAVDPVNLGKALRGRLVGSRRLRVGDYRIIYRVDKLGHTVTITKIGHRSTIYEK
jgi:mRNA interferase RelE/StbE